MEKGVLILAMGHPYYGRYAEQLCLSIKAVDPTAKVAVAHCEGALSHLNSRHFDSYIEIPREYYTTNDINDFIRAKTHLYELTPFQTTIFIDADVIWLPQKPIKDLFAQLDAYTFTMSNRGAEPLGRAKEGFIHWASPKLLIEQYKLKEDDILFNAASEFIYFKKKKEVQKLFKEAQKVYLNPPREYKKFAHSLPDELAFEVAMIKAKLFPHIFPFLPFYWEAFERRSLAPAEMYKQFYAYSMGGNTNKDSQNVLYNNLANHYNAKFNIRGYFPARSKKSWLPERNIL